MKTKKLVLCFCALTSITGSATKVFGSEVAGGASQALGGGSVLDKLQQLVLNGKDGILSDDKDRDAEYKRILRLTDAKVCENNLELAALRKEEIENVQEALSCEHRAYFHRCLAAKNLSTCKTPTAKQELEIATEELESILGINWKRKRAAKDRVEKQKAELMDAETHDSYVLQKCRQHNDAAIECMESARIHKDRARDLREQRLERLVAVFGEYLREHGDEDRQESDRIKLEDENSGCTIVEKEQIRVKALQDLIIWASDDGLVENRVVAKIDDAIKSHVDGRWRTCAVDSASSCEGFQSVYHPLELGYDYGDLSNFSVQMAWLDGVFGRANELQGNTRIHWEGEDAKAGAAG
jgi:hypothetical protein